MENQKNKNGVIILLIVIIAILAVLCMLLGTGAINFKSSAQNSNEQSNTDEQTITNDNDSIANNSGNTNQNVINSNIVDNTKPLDGEIADSTNDVTSWTKEYSTATSYKVSKEFCGPPVPTSAFIFEIKNGILSLTNESTDESATLDGITNFKNMTYVQLFTSCYNYSIYLLTDDGKYYSIK